MNNCVPLIIPALIIILFLYLFYASLPWYYPIVKTSVSSNNGETFDENVLTIPTDKDIYVKYIISVKTRSLGRLLTGTNVYFTFTFPEEFKLYNYTGIWEENDSDKKEHFLIVVLNNIEKTEVIWRLTANKDNKDTPKLYELALECKIPFYKVYRKVLRLSEEVATGA